MCEQVCIFPKSDRSIHVSADLLFPLNYMPWTSNSIDGRPNSFYQLHACMCAQSLQLCPTLCDPVYCGLPGSSVHEIFQARILEWVAMPSPRGSSRLRDRTHISCVSFTVSGFFMLSHQGSRLAAWHFLIMNTL